MPTANETSAPRMNICTISVPAGAETAFLRKMSRNMGWKMSVSRAKKPKDPTHMTEQEFYDKIDRAKEQARSGETGPKFASAADLITYIKSL